MKAVLVVDMPESCLKCVFLNGEDECIVLDEQTNCDCDTWDKLKSKCPLRPLPERKDIIVQTSMYDVIRSIGWNACLDEIEGTK